MGAKYHFECEIYNSIDELSSEIRSLINQAKLQLNRAYAPYSKFYVGAAVLTENGTIYTGCNQENASFPLCICAERVALYNAGSNEEKLNIKAIAITATNPAKPLDSVCTPCGACRQVIKEFELRQNKPFDIYLTSEDNEIIKVEGISVLLPDSFSPEALL